MLVYSELSRRAKTPASAFSYKLRYVVGFGFISTSPKPTIYRNLYENTGPGHGFINQLKYEI